MKNIDSDPDGLAGTFLIAMPSMADTRFERTVVFVCAHGADGAMGLIVNKPAPGLMLNDLLGQLGIEAGPGGRNIPIHIGGPVEKNRGFALHSDDFMSDQATMTVTPEFRLTATLDVIEALAKGSGPASALLALGYAGWGPGQLEQEIRANGWLTAPSDPDLVYTAESDAIWHKALAGLGINPAALSMDGGQA